MTSEISSSHIRGLSTTDRVSNAFAHCLSLAAAPVFATMAVLTWPHAIGMQEMAVSGMQASPLESMAAMYLLMAGVHLAPWLRRPALRRGDHC